MSDQPRPVWLYPGERDLLAAMLDERDALSLAAAIVRRYDAAPADPAEAVREAVSTALRTGKSSTDAVLRALRMPDEK